MVISIFLFRQIDNTIFPQSIFYTQTHTQLNSTLFSLTKTPDFHNKTRNAINFKTIHAKTKNHSSQKFNLYTSIHNNKSTHLLDLL